MTARGYKHIIRYSQRQGKSTPSAQTHIERCALRNEFSGYCAHPLIDQETLECKYALSEIKVPRSCPLKKKSLTIKLGAKKVEEQ
ncbi:hypothetical protein GOV14_01960 [Candidatus Pacearchaeota archaeon]|nr:hypothetical protein [Candidatus Pacearchaeota archaeon]